MTEVGYNRTAAVEYAKKWAMSRNPAYYSFDNIGGDCTGFVSQSVYAGAGVMNYTPIFGWYYISPDDRAPAWTGVEYFYNFFTTNQEVGPYAREVSRSGAIIGDVVQLGDREGGFYHSLIICGFRGNEPLICAHSQDAYMRPLYSYHAARTRYLHILGVRAE